MQRYGNGNGNGETPVQTKQPNDLIHDHVTRPHHPAQPFSAAHRSFLAPIEPNPTEPSCRLSRHVQSPRMPQVHRTQETCK
jgi:hypothetical protein